ncbi:hypothetical protein C2U69_11280 [Cupriavidus pinatubonensis]|nr:hypothetical protein C2U69_11280 [Cupriavidus pinatubonensis]
MDVLEELEQRLGKPVLSTTQVSLWAALRMIGETEAVPGFGRLLRQIADSRNRAGELSRIVG